MADILFTDLSREQIRWCDQIIEVVGEPVDIEGSVAMVKAIEAVRLWYLEAQQRMRRER
jgi:hypothetical protein